MEEPKEGPAANMSITKQYEEIKKMWWYQKTIRNYYRKKHNTEHWWAIVMQKDKPNELVCIKCKMLCTNEEEYSSKCGIIGPDKVYVSDEEHKRAEGVLDDLLSRESGLSSKEMDFIDDMDDKRDAKWSYPQVNWLDIIYKRVCN